MSLKTRYFLDTEFIEDGKTIDLVSIGLVCADGRTFYRQNAECKFELGSDWMWRNVYPHLLHFDMRGRRSCHERKQCFDSGLSQRTISTCGDVVDDPCPWGDRREIRNGVLEFCNVEKYGKPEFWGYFADYDWVVFCQLFGTMMELPKGFPMYCKDIKQWVDQIQTILISQPETQIHHALVDAQWAKEAYDTLSNHSHESSYLEQQTKGMK